MTFEQRQPLLEDSWQCSVQYDLWRLNSFHSLLRQMTGRLVDPLGFWWIEFLFILKGELKLRNNRCIFAQWIKLCPESLGWAG